MAIGGTVRHARARIGLSIQEAADRAGLTRQTWSAIERGVVCNPQAETLGRIAHALGMTIEELAPAEPDQTQAVLRLWAAMGPKDRVEVMEDMVRRALPFDGANDPLARAAG